jgi:hypothetical protein
MRSVRGGFIFRNRGPSLKVVGFSGACDSAKDSSNAGRFNFGKAAELTVRGALSARRDAGPRSDGMVLEIYLTEPPFLAKSLNDFKQRG